MDTDTYENLQELFETADYEIVPATDFEKRLIEKQLTKEFYESEL